MEFSIGDVKSMCGVLGIYNKLPLTIAKTLLNGLINRGQDASGLVWIDSYGVHQSSKYKGVPMGIKVPSESSTRVIGSTRYPTAGDREGNAEVHKFAQPFSYQTKKGTLSIAHNGNITNIKELTSEKFQSDAEFITLRLGALINETENLEYALIKLTEELDGAYSLVGILGEDMFCFRDPRGIRPLIYGTNGIQHYISSESSVLQQARCQTMYDLNAGELLYIQNNEVIRKQLVKAEKIAHCYFEYVYFAGSASTIDERNVYSVRLMLGKNLGLQVTEKQLELDFVIPIPDTSKAAASTVAETLGLPLREAIMKNRSAVRTFIMPGVDYRENAAKTKYLFVDEFIKDKKILIVDDSIVRGLTMNYLIRILREKGAVEVHVAITCPPQRFACLYGVDFGTDEELIASGDKSIDCIREELGADTLTYLSFEGLVESIGRSDLCTACLTGKYPTPHGELIRLRLKDGLMDTTKSYYE
ncbi:MAG: amidophosphoribosyltransferase [Candidatus Heimdallarchaeota archaeon]|nr:amidophosphoribosyltransferase [Candidatus Heimdallarchaeota archaeon]